MNHQPFEKLIFQDEPLDELERNQLREHLIECKQCRELSMGWKTVVWQLHQSEMVAPEEGFVNRWKARLEVEKKRAYKRQAILFLSLSIGAAFLLCLGILMVTVPIFQNPGLLFWTYIDRLISLFTAVDIFRDIFFSLYLSVGQQLGSSPGWISFLPLFMVLSAGIAVEVLVLWFITLRKITVQKGTRI